MSTTNIKSHETNILARISTGWAIFYLTAALWISALVFQFFLPLNSIYGKELVLLDVSEGFIDGFGFLCFTLVGAMLLDRGNKLGKAYLLPGLAYNLGWLLTNYSIYGLFVSPLPAFVPMALSGNIAFVIAIGVSLAVIPLLYPTGQPWSHFGNYLYKLSIATIITGVVVITITPGPVNDPLFTAANPLGIENAKSVLELIMGIVLIALVVLILAATLSIIIRIRNTEPGTRKKYMLLLLGEVILVGVFFSDSFIQPIFPIWGPIAPLIAIPAIPVATYLALLRGN